MGRRKRLVWGAFAAILLAVAGISAFFIFYHPPMRLMPAPLLFQGGALPIADLEPTPRDGTRIEVFYGSSRRPIGPQDARIYAVVPDTALHLGRATLRIGDEGSTLDQLFEWSTGAERTDRPFIHLERMREYATLDEPMAPAEPAAEARPGSTRSTPSSRRAGTGTS